MPEKAADDYLELVEENYAYADSKATDIYEEMGTTDQSEKSKDNQEYRKLPKNSKCNDERGPVPAPPESFQKTRDRTYSSGSRETERQQRPLSGSESAYVPEHNNVTQPVCQPAPIISLNLVTMTNTTSTTETPKTVIEEHEPRDNSPKISTNAHLAWIFISLVLLGATCYIVWEFALKSSETAVSRTTPNINPFSSMSTGSVQTLIASSDDKFTNDTQQTTQNPKIETQSLTMRTSEFQTSTATSTQVTNPLTPEMPKTKPNPLINSSTASQSLKSESQSTITQGTNPLISATPRTKTYSLVNQNSTLFFNITSNMSTSKTLDTKRRALSSGDTSTKYHSSQTLTSPAVTETTLRQSPTTESSWSTAEPPKTQIPESEPTSSAFEIRRIHTNITQKRTLTSTKSATTTRNLQRLRSTTSDRTRHADRVTATRTETETLKISPRAKYQRTTTSTEYQSTEPPTSTSQTIETST